MIDKEDILSATHLFVEWGKTTAAGTKKLFDHTKLWQTDIWVNDQLVIVRGTGAGQIRTITANAHNSLTIGKDWDTLPDDTSEYVIRERVVEIGSRAISKTIRDITPDAVGTFWLPQTGKIDLSKYLASSWGIYAPTTATMVINCYLNISHDGGTTWRRAAGYEILDADFVRDAWNTIDCPLKLAEAKLEVVIGTAYPAELDLLCIAKP